MSNELFPGWELLSHSETAEDGTVTFRLELKRTYAGEFTEVDWWVLRYGKAYLEDCLQRAKENLLARSMVEWGESFTPPLIGTPKGVIRE